MAQAQRILLRAQPREVTGKAVKQLRRDGITPIVVYGPRSEPVALQTSSKDLIQVLGRAGGTQLIAIEVEGEKAPRLTLAKDVQRHTTKLVPIHADFIQVVMDEPISKEVPLSFIGESAAVKHNEGLLATPLDRIMVRALPDHLPPYIEVDVSGLASVGDSIHVSALALPEGVEAVADAETIVARIEAARMHVEAEEELEELEGEAAEGEGAEAGEDGEDVGADEE